MAATQQSRPNPQAVQRSMGIIVSGVHKRAFLHKLAELGHVPESQQEEDQLVELGFKLASVDPSVTEPNPFLHQAPAKPRGKYASAVADLDQVLGLEKTAESDRIYDAALALAQDPQIYSAALTIKQAAAAAQTAG
jgi:hypothetical protein